MGNTCGCCTAEEDAKKDSELDKYIKTHHILKYPHKCPKLMKQDQLLKLDCQDYYKTHKCNVNMEILDEKSKKQDIQSPETIDTALLEEISQLSNALTNDHNEDKGTDQSKVNQRNKDQLLEEKKIVDYVDVKLFGEYGTGGKPLKIKPTNPYLEIDLIDPNDPVLYEGEVQKYKPGFQAQFIDRWIQVTAKAFRYFVSKPAKDCPIIKPLLAIPMLGVKACEIVNYTLPIKKKDLKGQELAKHQFELFLKEDFVKYYLSSIYEKHFSPDGKRINTGIQFLERNEGKKKQFSPSKKGIQLDLKEKYMKEEENLLEEPLQHAAMNTLNTHYGAWTNREEMWILEDRRLLFATKTDYTSDEWAQCISSVCKESEDPNYAPSFLKNDVENE
ncbi:UNKNOWN [Stylonychia lemnae]|uniref:Uncharacterized protein n=1 Tax=Stylonychia lemnae TaxID=5949 RepID=A0A078BBE3_STYLE|nr:UNKNOWN [Stylonychia lemnae]|eukprot:CDW91526.1 UNKNOWN [Stylonychia lemnae]